jgi:hypothetical protein
MECDRKTKEAADIGFPKSGPRKRLDSSHNFDRYCNNIGDDGFPGGLLHRRALERNRIAAKKCRVRKREEASALASREQALEDQNRYLYTQYKFLSTEIYLLKTELLRHINCNSTLIQEYITNEARRSMDQLNASPLAMYPCGDATPNKPDNRTRRTSYLDAEAIALDGHNPLGDPMVEPSSNRRSNELPDSTAITPNLTYFHDSPNADIHNSRYDNIPGNAHDQLDDDVTGIYQWPFPGAKFG